MNSAEERTTGSEWPWLGLLVLATALAHSTALDGDFVFDDFRFVPENPAIRDLGNLPGFFTDAATMTATPGTTGWNDIYRPLRTLAFAIDWKMFGPNATGYRVVSLIWHLVAVALAWLLLRRLLGDYRAATIGAGLFALHPIQAQSVSWISSRGDLMAAVFLLGAALLLLRERPTRRGLAGGIVLYTCALFSKENAIALLAIVPIHDRLFSEAKPRWRLYGVLALVTVLFLVARMQVAVGQIPFEAALWLDAGSALIVTIGSLLFPAGLPAYTGHIFGDGLGVATGGLVLAAAAALAVYLFREGRRWPHLAFAVLWFAACLAPVSGLLPLKSLAESRFAYLPALGFGMLLALLVRNVPRRGRDLGFVTLALLGLWTARESRMWRDDFALWETAIARESRVRGEATPFALLSLGIAHAEVGDHEAAITTFRRSIAAGESGTALAQLGLQLLETGRKDEAVAAASRGVVVDPNSLAARDLFGRILYATGHAPGAIEQFSAAVAIAPAQAHLRHRLGQALLASRRLPEAVTQLGEAVRLAPEFALAYVDLGKAHLGLRQLDAAERAFRRAADLRPGAPAPQLYLGRVMVERKRPGDALPFLERASALAPSHPLVRAVRGAALAAVQGRLAPEQIADVDAACYQLARTGKFDEVLSIVGRAEVRRLRSPALENHLARSALHARRFDLAVDVIRELLTRRPDDFLLHMTLARAHRGANRPADAARAAEEAGRCARDDRQRAEVRAFLGE